MTNLRNDRALCAYLLLLLGLSHGTVMFLLVEDLLHLAVLQVVQFPHGIFRPLDQIHEDPRRPITTYKVMLENRTEPRVRQLARTFFSNGRNIRAGTKRKKA